MNILTTWWASPNQVPGETHNHAHSDFFSLLHQRAHYDIFLPTNQTNIKVSSLLTIITARWNTKRQWLLFLKSCSFTNHMQQLPTSYMCPWKHKSAVWTYAYYIPSVSAPTHYNMGLPQVTSPYPATDYCWSRHATVPWWRYRRTGPLRATPLRWSPVGRGSRARGSGRQQPPCETRRAASTASVMERGGFTTFKNAVSLNRAKNSDIAVPNEFHNYYKAFENEIALIQGLVAVENFPKLTTGYCNGVESGGYGRQIDGAAAGRNKSKHRPTANLQGEAETHYQHEHQQQKKFKEVSFRLNSTS